MNCTEDEFNEFMGGLLAGMLFTAGHLSDNDNAPAAYSSGDVPDWRERFPPARAEKLAEAARGFLSGEGVVEAIREADAALGKGFEDAGTDFHLTRNGHGCGFWDGDWDLAGSDGAKVLDEWASTFGSCELETVPNNPEQSNDGPLWTDENGHWSYYNG